MHVGIICNSVNYTDSEVPAPSSAVGLLVFPGLSLAAGLLVLFPVSLLSAGSPSLSALMSVYTVPVGLSVLCIYSIMLK